MAVKLDIYKRSIEPRRQAIGNWKIPAAEKAALLQFLDELALGRVNKGRKISEVRQLKYLVLLKVPLEHFTKPATKLTLKDVESFEKDLSSGQIRTRSSAIYSHATKVDIRRALRGYLRWRLGEERANKLTDWFDTRDMVKTPDFLKEAEMEKLYKACKTARERYLVAVLFDSGARAAEFHNLRYEDVQLPEGATNYVRLALKEEYSKTKGRTISLYWRHSLEAVKDFLAERMREGIKTEDPVYDLGYNATRFFLLRLGKRVLGRSIHYHLFRHSSATYYADKMNRQQLCIRYGWTFSSNMPDIYIARAGVDSKELDEKFTSTTMEKLQRDLVEQKEESQIKNDRIKLLESQVQSLHINIEEINKALALKPTVQELEDELRRRR